MCLCRCLYIIFCGGERPGDAAMAEEIGGNTHLRCRQWESRRLHSFADDVFATSRAMTREDDFEARLGRIRSTKGGKGARYLQGVLRGVARATTGATERRASRFDGSRIGRGSGVGRVLSARDRHSAFRARRVVIQTRVIRLKQQDVNAARMHLRYLERDGVTRAGLPGELYDERKDRADGRAFLERTGGDRHQFRFIVSAEDGATYDDLKSFIRRLMEQMEKDLSTRLDWVAVDHYNTAHPHTHVVLRGKDGKGNDLVIAREYISHGMRERASEIVSIDLGPRTDREIEQRLRMEVEQERLTSIDRDLLRERNEAGFVQAAHRDAFRQSIRAGRLQKLQRLGLTEDVGSGLWRLRHDTEPTLKAMGERGDIIKTIHRAITQSGLARSAADYAIMDTGNTRAPVIGRVIARGLADELRDRHYLIIDGIDGRVHHVGVGQADAEEPTREGTIVAIHPRSSAPRRADRVIAEVAGAHEGRYSPELHRTHDPTASASYVDAHVRRLEDMRRAGAPVEREVDGAWKVAPNYLTRVAAIEARRSLYSPVVIDALSRAPLARQVQAMAATWLDRELVAENPTTLVDGGFGREVRNALWQRRQWLIEQDLAHVEQEKVVYRAGLLTELRRREFAQTGAALEGEIGVPYVEARTGSRIEGVYRQRIDLISGRFAVIERTRDFTLVPWRPVLERNLGKPVSGIMRGDTISWSLMRQRGGPSIS